MPPAAVIRSSTAMWTRIFQDLLGSKPTSVLDLGCGPGLYSSRLARLGCSCTGIDFSPASIAYARLQAQEGGLACQYIEADLRTATFGAGFGLVLFIFGELNVFRPRRHARFFTRHARHWIRVVSSSWNLTPLKQ